MSTHLTRTPRAAVPTFLRSGLALLGAATLAVTGPLGSTSASAAEYRAYSCQTPDGQPAATTGWRWGADPTLADGIAFRDTCSEPGGALRLAFQGDKTATFGHSIMGWASPAESKVKAARIARYGDVRHPDYRVYTTTPYGYGFHQNCTSSTGTCWNSTGAYNFNLTSEDLGAAPGGTDAIRLELACTPAGDINDTCRTSGAEHSAEYRMHGAEFILDDRTAPAGQKAAGTMISSPYWRGTRTFTATLSDAGAGVKSFALQHLDQGTWTTVAAPEVPGNKASCAPLDTTGGLASYSDTQPCYARLNVSASWDTDELPEGPGEYRVVATDAVGNTGIAAPARKVLIDRTPPTIGAGDLVEQCETGERIVVTPTASDSSSGVDTATTEVHDTDGTTLPVGDDGTIVCPDSARGPLTSTTTVKDKAGNTTVESRAVTIAVQAPQPAPSLEEQPVGNGGYVAPSKTYDEPFILKSSTPTPTAPEAPVTRATPTSTPARTVAAAALVACTRESVVLTAISPGRTKDVISGSTAAKFVGQTVTISFGARREAIASTRVAADGTFTASVAAPKGKAGRGNSARYVATIGAVRSPAVKRQRRMYATTVKRTPSGISVAGRLVAPFARTTSVSVQVQIPVQTPTGTRCTNWTTVKSVPVGRGGTYATTVPVSTSGDVVLVRTTAQVPVSVATARKTRTQTLTSAVKVR
jgi:hypothetical protein